MKTKGIRWFGYSKIVDGKKIFTLPYAVSLRRSLRPKRSWKRSAFEGRARRSAEASTRPSRLRMALPSERERVRVRSLTRWEWVRSRASAMRRRAESLATRMRSSELRSL